MKKVPLAAALLALAALAPAQYKNTEDFGVEVQIKSIANFRGIVANQLLGFGLVTGLAGTGDSKKFLQTQKALINLLRPYFDIDPTQSESKNVALVTLTAELPPFSTPGGRIDVTASAIGDSSSLRGGTLIFAPLKYPGLNETYATAAGAISVGGFATGAGGNSQGRNFTTVGKLPGGAIIQRSLPTETVSKDGKMYLDLQVSDATTAERMEEAITKRYPEFHAAAMGAGTIEVTLPKGMSSNTAQAKIGAISVFADTEAKIIIDEKTGTIVMGGNVRVAPCSVVKGGLSVRVVAEPFVSQPAPFSNGTTVKGTQKTLDTKEQTAEIANIRANTSVADLAVIFQTLRLKADDVINILRAMREQGALKARLEVR